MTKRTISLLALGLCGVSNVALACSDAPMSMKDASVTPPTVVASAQKSAPVQTTKAAATQKTPATTPAKSSEPAATRH